jgi:hypothetical protein
MAEQQPKDASRKSKAEGERFSSAGREDRDRFRASLYTPRRYEQPIEDDDDPVMPSDDATGNTKI